MWHETASHPSPLSSAFCELDPNAKLRDLRIRNTADYATQRVLLQIYVYCPSPTAIQSRLCLDIVGGSCIIGWAYCVRTLGGPTPSFSAVIGVHNQWQCAMDHRGNT
jgi:hypothetical protein